MSANLEAEVLSFTSDASANKNLGFGMVFDKEWSFGQWEQGFIEDCNPSIEDLELFALCAGVFIWSHKLANRQVVVACDNQSAVYMVNSTTSSCHNCMHLLRMLTLQSLRFNFRVYARHVRGIWNGASDALSRLKLNLFFNKFTQPQTKAEPEPLPRELWPLTRIWQK